MLLIAKSLEGHRKSYLNFFILVFGGRLSNVYSCLFSRDTVVFLMIEEGFFCFFSISMFRAIFRLKTVGFLFRPREAVERLQLRHKVKYSLLRFLKLFPSASTVSIVPGFLIPSQQEIVKDWIYDFQLWDLNYELVLHSNKNEFPSEIAKLVTSRSNSRSIVCSLGVQSLDKGVDIFMSAYCNSEELRKKFFFVCAGKLKDINRELIEKFYNVGGFVLNDFVTDSDMHALYSISDIIWAWYSPRYDQASGIAGRAFQLGVTPILRNGSLVQRLFLAKNINHLSCSENDLIFYLLNMPPPVSCGRFASLNLSNKFAEESVNKLRLLI